MPDSIPIKKPATEKVTDILEQSEEMVEIAKSVTPDSVDRILDQANTPIAIAKDSIGIFERISLMFKKKKKKK